MKKFLSLRNLFLSFALLIIALCAAGTVKANAAVSYDPQTDSLKSDSGEYVCILSKDGTKLKAGTQLTSLATPVTLTSLGAKSTKKDVYVYVTTASSIAEDVESAKATLVIKAQTAKKLVGAVNYTQGDNEESTKALMAYCTDSNNKEAAVEGRYIYWSETADGTYAPAETFTGKMLSDAYATGKTIYIKMLGDATTRSSAAVKVKIAKQKGLPKVKLDVKKSTLSIKNGFDFASYFIDEETGGAYFTDWYTVLPYLKDAQETQSIFNTKYYVPLDKKKEEALKTAQTRSGEVSYTKTKLKALSLTALYEALGYDESEYTQSLHLMVRKSATSKAPASGILAFTLAGQAEAPYVDTMLKYDGDYLILQTDASATKIVVPNIRNAGSYTGIGDNLVLDENGKSNDSAAAKYEYLIVDPADIASIDWSATSWKTLKAGAKLTLGKQKTGYTILKDGTASKKTAILDAASSSTAWEDFEEGEVLENKSVKSVLLIRRAGVKGSNVETSIQASDYVVTFFVKETVGGVTKTNWYTTKSMGDTGYKYTIKFQTRNDKGELVDNEAMTIVGVVPTECKIDPETEIGEWIAQTASIELNSAYTKYIDTSKEADEDKNIILGELKDNKYTITVKEDNAVLELRAVKTVKLTADFYTRPDPETEYRKIDNETVVYDAEEGAAINLAEIDELTDRVGYTVAWADTIELNKESLTITKVEASGDAADKYMITLSGAATIKLCVERIDSVKVTAHIYTRTQASLDLEPEYEPSSPKETIEFNMGSRVISDLNIDKVTSYLAEKGYHINLEASLKASQALASASGEANERKPKLIKDDAGEYKLSIQDMDGEIVLCVDKAITVTVHVFKLGDFNEYGETDVRRTLTLGSNRSYVLNSDEMMNELNFEIKDWGMLMTYTANLEDTAKQNIESIAGALPVTLNDASEYVIRTGAADAALVVCYDYEEGY